jgi:transposase
LTTKRELVVDRNGTPLAFTLDRGPVHELKLAVGLLEQISIPGCKGRPKKRLGKLLGDRLYASRSFRETLLHWGTVPCIPRKALWGTKKGLPRHSGPRGYRNRYVVERTFAWLNKFRRIAVRYDHSIDAYSAFLTLGMIRIVLRKFRNRCRNI